MQAVERKKALVVDDSAFMRKVISDMITKRLNIEVVGIARNGEDAVQKVISLKPDVVTMDIEMPIMNGLEALKKIMEVHPIPIVMLASETEVGAEKAMLAMEYGAFDFVAKPGGSISLNLHEVEEDIIQKIAAASGVQIRELQPSDVQDSSKHSGFPVLHRVAQEKKPDQIKETIHNFNRKLSKTSRRFVIIGTSTGGPRALQEVITRLPASIQAPILIVQHMPAGFTKSLAERLNGMSAVSVKEAEDGEVFVNGTAYIAPGGKHLKIVKNGANYCAELSSSELPRMGHRPAVDVLLESAADYPELSYVSVIMTGMGSDGKEGMRLLKNNCDTYVIAESEETAVVYGMPKSIVEAGLADEVLQVQSISNAILEIVKL